MASSWICAEDTWREALAVAVETDIVDIFLVTIMKKSNRDVV